jgi:hypothetical protein
MKSNQKSDDTADQNKQQDTVKAGERKRDEQRDGGPRYGGEAWEVADERGAERFGHARNDDAEPSELVKNDPDVEDADPNIESGGEQAGMGRGEKPRKPKSRADKNG